MKHINAHLSGAVRRFAYWVANRSVGYPLLQGTDYSVIFAEPSSFEMAFAIFMNNLQVDDRGEVVNEKQAEYRAAQYIKCYVDPSYQPDPPFQDWEGVLY